MGEQARASQCVQFEISVAGNRITYGLLPVALLVACSAQDGPTKDGAEMADANRLRESREFLEATARLQALADASAQDGRLCHNLRAAYLKSSDLGRAVLNFRRAPVLLPRDDDVAANPRLTSTMTFDHVEIDGRENVASVACRIIEWTTLNKVACTALLPWILAGALVTDEIVSPRSLHVCFSF